MAAVWNGTCMDPTAGVPNTAFYSCEVDKDNTSYMYMSCLYFFQESPMTPTSFRVPRPLHPGRSHQLLLGQRAGSGYAGLLFPNHPDHADRLDDPPVDQLAPLDEDIQAGPVTVYRLREGVEQFMITDINNPASASMAQRTSAS